MAWDPRSSRKYQATRQAWLPTADPTCCLCHTHVDALLPAGYPASPTVEHTLPIRVILAQTQTRQAAIDLACDTDLWLLAHSRCQSRQGAAVTNSRTKPREGASRRW
jgi:5-methylcytosine-specific restriction endonuclease McrA